MAKEIISKQALREQAERLMREAAANNTLKVTQGETRIDATCGKCGAPNRVKAKKGETRVTFTCKECGHAQKSL